MSIIARYSIIESSSKHYPAKTALKGVCEMWLNKFDELGLVGTVEENIEAFLGYYDSTFATLELIRVLAELPVAAQLQSSLGSGTVCGDIWSIGALLDSDDREIKKLIPLFKAVLLESSDDVLWGTVDEIAQIFGHPEALQPPLAVWRNRELCRCQKDNYDKVSNGDRKLRRVTTPASHTHTENDLPEVEGQTTIVTAREQTKKNKRVQFRACSACLAKKK